MAKSGDSLEDYIFGETYDGERLEIVHRINKANFVKAMEQVLNEYGLAERLEQAQANHTKVQILDIGCAEGLYLHDLAAILESRQWLAAVELNGLDFDAKAIATAEEYSKQATPPRPYLNFYLHDATQPFEASLGLRAENKLQFDFIFLLSALGSMPNARQHLHRFYQSLKPGGVIYLSSVVLSKGEKGWLSAHPVLETFSQIFFDVLAEMNSGVDVANAASDWLKEWGAVQVQADLHIRPTGGETEVGRLNLRNIVMTMRNAAPFLIKNGKVSQAQYQETMATLYRELGPQSQGQVASVNTFARKPSNQ